LRHAHRGHLDLQSAEIGHVLAHDTAEAAPCLDAGLDER
jgi:hypothetical protein